MYLNDEGALEMFYLLGVLCENSGCSACLVRRTLVAVDVSEAAVVASSARTSTRPVPACRRRPTPIHRPCVTPTGCCRDQPSAIA